MTVRYVASTGSNTSPYDTWAKACTTLKTVTDLMGAGDITYAKNEAHVISATTTYTMAGTVANPCILISTADTTNAPPTTVDAGLSIDASAQTGAINLKINGKFIASGIDITPSSSTGLGSIFIADTDESICVFEDSTFRILNTHASARIHVGQSNGNAKVITKRCTFTLGNSASQTTHPNNFWESYEDTFNITTTQPTAYFSPISNGNGAIMRMEGADLSAITSTLFAGTLSGGSEITLFGCKLGSGVAITATITGPAHAEIFVIGCSSGDFHYEFAHYNYWGNTTVSTAIYLNTTSGASYNVADAKYSWRIESVNGTYQTPYVTPWIDIYNEATAAVTPRLEVIRDGSTTAYNDDQLWAEFAYKGASGSTRMSYVNDRRGLAATAAAQASSSLGASDWTGETTPWYGKLEPASAITPAEIGLISARFCLAGAIVAYGNPRILGI